MKLGLHAVCQAGWAEAVEEAARLGFDYVQGDLNVPAFFLDGLDGAALAALRRRARDAGVALTLHAPGDNVSLCCDFPLVRRGVLEQFALILEKAGELGARHVTLHAGAYPRFRLAGEAGPGRAFPDEAHYAAALAENLSFLLGRRGEVLLCLENDRLDAVSMSAADRLLGDGLRLALDTAKMYREGRPDGAAFSFMMARSAHIRELHISDIIPGLGSHQIFGAGLVNFTPYLDLMRRDDVWLTFEARPAAAAAESMRRLLDFLAGAGQR